MSVDAAIREYMQLSKTVFKPRKRNLLGGSLIQNLFGNATFDGKVLEMAVKRVVRENLTSDREGSVPQEHEAITEQVKDSLDIDNSPLFHENSKCKMYVYNSSEGYLGRANN